jgi:hypothetical protein
MPVIKIGSESYDSTLLSNSAKSLLIELAELDFYITQIKEDLLLLKEKREKLSKETFEAIQTAKLKCIKQPVSTPTPSTSTPLN